jgi:hypothetical protein
VQAHVPKGFKTALFGRVWNRPLCSLFAWRNATDFAGTCDELPSTCLEKKWCAARPSMEMFGRHHAPTCSWSPTSLSQFKTVADCMIRVTDHVAQVQRQGRP